MRNLISVAVILHVAFTAAGLQLEGKEVEFGDMITFTPKCKAKIKYQHYAVFVGDEYPGQGNIFEHSKRDGDFLPDCFFSTLDLSKGPYVLNFLDGYDDGDGTIYNKGSVAEMKARINKKLGNCGLYNPFCNNCEHLATYVRYGEKISLQYKMTAEFFCIRKKAKDMLKYVKKISESPAMSPSSSG